MNIGDEVFWIKGPFKHTPQKTQYNLSKILKFTPERVLIETKNSGDKLYVWDANLKKKDDLPKKEIRLSESSRVRFVIIGSARVKKDSNK